MARKPRIHFAGALYHVICRGNQGQSIFKNDRDPERYLGDDEFVEGVEQQESNRAERQIVEISWAEIRDRVYKQFGLPASAVLHRGRAREVVRVRRVMASLGRELGGLTNHALAKELQLEAMVLSRDLGKLAEELPSNPELRGVVETLCDSLRKGRRLKRSIRFA